ncbi:xanthine dehydrogenase [Anaerocolumna cellulosilytica]|uniref:Xanthine dehydrogenase n=1 Tax=Anaerocolumna cellulosilytica TaxID=433286 RepID=A0A6S6RCD0_9FIRM|nr:XdhC/CoxI family protein [Anaerocolumna cellulosilytica]MBB5198097.1 xanthine dehydrogenase accessory factor [Anaerocolumna cellulosilytica]BCJ96498.1 xanthine dehydrogenase [Anaerocolumna cellulosilytica]
MNLYGTLLKELEDDRNQVILTCLSGREGSLETNFERSIHSKVPEKLKQVLEQEDIDYLKEGKAGICYDEDGTLIVYESFYPGERLIVLGGGHIALPLVEFASKVGFTVIVADDRPYFANQIRFPFAEQVICNSFDKVLKGLKVTASDYIVIITRGHRHDLNCLRQILKKKETKYVGMIGSKRRVKGILALLKEEGYDDGRLSRICTPIGLSIGAVTPEEISISIVAQLIGRKRQGQRGEYKTNQPDADYNVLKLLADSEGEAMAVVTVIDTKGSVPRGVGAKMIVYPTGQIAGSIGGGCSEAVVIRNAVSIIGTKKFRIQTIDMTGDVAEAEGMVCGGIMEVLIEDHIT